MLEQIRLPFTVPYSAQIASPDLAAAIFDEHLDPGLDPRWRESGAESPHEYAFWCFRACGAACVKMCVEALGGPTDSLMEWVRRGVSLAGYLTREDDSGQTEELGWSHTALANLIQSQGFKAQAAAAALDGIITCLQKGQLVIASTSYEIGTNAPITHKGGHLVVVLGAECQEGCPVSLLLHNPSGRSPDLRENAVIAADRFSQAYTGRIISVYQG